MNFRVELGYCGPTDCCLKLYYGADSKEYGIESPAWFLIEKFWDTRNQKGQVISEEHPAWLTLYHVWLTRDEDIV